MVERRKQESDADFSYGLFDNLRSGVEVDAEVFQQVGTAAFALYTAVAVFGDRHPAAGNNKGGGG
jgi:hypothetical protein